MVHCVILYNMNILDINSGTPQNQNLSKPEFPRNPTIFSFYLHCIKNPGKFLYSGNRTSFLYYF